MVGGVDVMAGQRWTAAEEDYLRTFAGWPRRDGIEAAAVGLKRSFDAVEARARKIRVRWSLPPKSLSAADHAFILANIRVLGAQRIADLLKKKKTTVADFGRRHGLSSPPRYRSPAMVVRVARKLRTKSYGRIAMEECVSRGTIAGIARDLRSGHEVVR